MHAFRDIQADVVECANTTRIDPVEVFDPQHRRCSARQAAGLTLA